jgi:4-amino-4-deoxy-L-arabinose transferase-like glycosyltransferase
MMALERRDGLFFVVIFFGLFVRLALAPPIWHHGEAREALVVQGIVRNREWILPLRNGEIPSKPPFFHWLAALPAFVFGPSDLIVRLPSTIGAATMAGATFFMGSQMGGVGSAGLPPALFWECMNSGFQGVRRVSTWSSPLALRWPSPDSFSGTVTVIDARARLAM